MLLTFKIGFIEISWIDLLDIGLVTLLLFQLYRIMRGSLAVKIFLGFLSLYLIFLLVKAADLQLLTALLGQFVGIGVLAIVILFQQEIRKFLLMLGKSTSGDDNFIKNLINRRKTMFTTANLDINPIIDAAKSLAATNTGALIVFAKQSELKFYAESGDILDAEVNKRLLMAIFHKSSPLHDGAVIIEGTKIKAARCILPLSENDQIPAKYGLRHRAAIGITEVSDCIVLIVSEETGKTSLAVNGQMYSKLTRTEIKLKLRTHLFDARDEQNHKEELEEFQKM